MKSKPTLTLAVAVIAIAFTILGLRAADDAGAPQVGQQWQHLAFETDPEKAISDPEVARQIVKLGEEGWELVTVLNFSREGTTTRTVYYFKKPRT